MTRAAETIVLIVVGIVLTLTNCATGAAALHLIGERDRMAEETTHCYTAFNAVYTTCRNAGACRDLDR